jgi:hypothetical protein
VTIGAQGGSTVTLTAEGSSDPDGNQVTLTWWIYPEAGTLPAPDVAATILSSNTGTTTQVHLPAVTAPGTLHIILQAEDDGTPHLFAYRRAVLSVTP